MTAHAKGLLATFEVGDRGNLALGREDKTSLLTIVDEDSINFAALYHADDAKRLAACWNLLDGYPTEELEGVTLAEFVASHPELAEKALIAAYASLFAERGATNYLEVKGARPELGPFNITLQRTEGLTPVEKLEAMTKQRDVLLEALNGVLGVMNNSQGVAGWHMNGAIATWDELLPEVSAALEFVIVKRCDCTLSDKRGAFGPCMEERKEGMFVPFFEVDTLNKRINQLIEERNSTGIAISNAIISGVVPDKHPLRSRLELLANHHKRERELESLLREARSPLIFAMEESSEDKSVAIEELIDIIDSVLAGQALECVGSNALAMMMDELHDICVVLDAPGGAQNGDEAWAQVKMARDRVLASLHQGRPDAEWTDATAQPVAADYRELQEQYDQLQSKHKGALDLLRELREGAEIHLHNCKVCKNEEGVNNWTGKLARIDTALDGKFPLPAWYLDGAKDFKSMMLEATRAVFHPHIEGVFAVFERQLALDAPQGGEPCATASPSSNPA